MTPTPRWPSPLPGPAWASWRTAWDHIEVRTLAGLPAATVRLVRQVPAVRQAEDHAIALAHTGNVLATRASCQAWLRAIKAALAALRTEEAA
jgi:hypothetical protein